MQVLADTSGLYALLDASDGYHRPACRAWKELVESDQDIVVHHFVFHEVCSLLQARLGFEAVELFLRDFLPLMTLCPVAQEVLWRGITR